MIASGSNYSTYKDITICVDKTEFTKTSVSQFNVVRNYNLHNVSIMHSDDTSAVEYAPIKNVISSGLQVGSIGKDTSFEVTLDIDTSINCGLFNSNGGNCDFNLYIKDGKIIGELIPRICDELNKYDAIKFNKNVLDYGTLITIDGDLNGLRTYKYTTTSINEPHKIDKWQVKRVSDNELFWVDQAKSESAENNYVTKGTLVYTDMLNGSPYYLANENEFEYVDPIVQGEIAYVQQHNFVCTSGETEIFNVTFKTHKQIETNINCMFNSYASDSKAFIVMSGSKSNNVTMPEFWSQYDVPSQSHLIDDGTYLIVTDYIQGERTYKAIHKKYCQRDVDGVWIDGKLENKYIVGSFTVLCNAIVDAFYYPQV